MATRRRGKLGVIYRQALRRARAVPFRGLNNRLEPVSFRYTPAHGGLHRKRASEACGTPQRVDSAAPAPCRRPNRMGCRRSPGRGRTAFQLYPIISPRSASDAHRCVRSTSCKAQPTARLNQLQSRERPSTRTSGTPRVPSGIMQTSASGPLTGEEARWRDRSRRIRSYSIS